MIRGLLLLGLVSQGYGLTTSAKGIKLYFYTSNVACDTEATAAALAFANLVAARYYPLGVCIALNAGSFTNAGQTLGTSTAAAGTREDSSVASGLGLFNVGTGANGGWEAANTGHGNMHDPDAGSMKWNATDVLPNYYSDVACATATINATTGTAATAWAVAGGATPETSTAVCSAGNSVASYVEGSEAEKGVTLAGLSTYNWITIALHKGSVVCGSALAAASGGLEMYPVASANTTTEIAKVCSRSGLTDSHYFACEAGVITYYAHSGSGTCAATGTSVVSLAMPRAGNVTNVALCFTSTESATAVGTGFAAGVAAGPDSWKITNSAAEYETICPAPTTAPSAATTAAATAAVGLAAAALIL